MGIRDYRTVELVAAHQARSSLGKGNIIFLRDMRFTKEEYKVGLATLLLKFQTVSVDDSTGSRYTGKPERDTMDREVHGVRIFFRLGTGDFSAEAALMNKCLSCGTTNPIVNSRDKRCSTCHANLIKKVRAKDGQTTEEALREIIALPPAEKAGYFQQVPGSSILGGAGNDADDQMYAQDSRRLAVEKFFELVNDRQREGKPVDWSATIREGANAGQFQIGGNITQEAIKRQLTDTFGVQLQRINAAAKTGNFGRVEKDLKRVVDASEFRRRADQTQSPAPASPSGDQSHSED